MTAVDTREPDTERAAWLEWRRAGIGASDLAGILGISPWSSPWSVWADKVGLVPADDNLDADDPREFGRRAEAMVAPWFADVTGLCVAGEQTWVTHPEHDWMRATVDGFVVEGPNGTVDAAVGLLEIKTTSAAPWTGIDPVPPHYQAQAQWQMAVTGQERVWFAVLHGRRLRTYVVERDEDDIAFMVDLAGRFWRDHVLTKVPPPVDSSDATLDAIRAVWPAEQRGTAVEVPEDVALRWRQAKAVLADAKAREQHARAELLAAVGDAEEARVDGRPVATCRTQRRTVVDAELLRKWHPRIHAEVLKTTEFRVLREVKETER